MRFRAGAPGPPDLLQGPGVAAQFVVDTLCAFDRGPPCSKAASNPMCHPPAPRALQAARARSVAVRAAAQRETDPKKRVVITGM